VEETKRILIVEDEEGIRAVIEEALQTEGYETHLAGSAEEAFAAIKSFKPHLVLTDHDMPGCTGLEFLKKLRKQDNHVALIFISARSEEKLIVEALKSGAEAYLKKPFRINILIAKVEASLRVNEVHEKLFAANQRLQELIDRDYLTGLYNMRSMYEKIDYEILRARRFKRSVSCVMMDLDNFKTVNDKFDHLFGSFIIKETGKIIKSTMREIDFAARYGGDEYLIVLTETKREGVQTFCERLHKTIKEHVFQDEDKTLQITVSIGFAMMTSDDSIDARELVRKADNALYEAKNAGRDRICGA